MGGVGVDFVKDDVVGGIGTEVVDLWLENALQVLGTIDVEVLNAPEKSEGGEHADESKSVIAMKVCEEDALEMGEGETGTSECHLGALCTIEHEEFLTNVDDL